MIRPSPAPAMATGSLADWRDTVRICRLAIARNQRRLASGDGDPDWLRLRIRRDEAWIAAAQRTYTDAGKTMPETNRTDSRKQAAR